MPVLLNEENHFHGADGSAFSSGLRLAESQGMRGGFEYFAVLMVVCEARPVVWHLKKAGIA